VFADGLYHKTRGCDVEIMKDLAINSVKLKNIERKRLSEEPANP